MKLLFITIPTLAFNLSSGAVIKTIVFIIRLWYFAISRKFFTIKSTFTLTLEFKDVTISYFLKKPIDIAVLSEIYVDKEYEWTGVQNPKVIVDLGAHFGDTSLYYHARFPDATVYAVEASPENFTRLEAHVSGIDNIIPVHAAVGSVDGELLLNVQESSFGHSLYGRSTKEEKISVPAMRLDTLISKYEIEHIDLLKFDIEGAEFDMLKSMSHESWPTAMIGELHYDLAKGNSLGDTVSSLERYTIHTEPIRGEDRHLLFALNKVLYSN